MINLKNHSFIVIINSFFPLVQGNDMCVCVINNMYTADFSSKKKSLIHIYIRLARLLIIFQHYEGDRVILAFAFVCVCDGFIQILLLSVFLFLFFFQCWFQQKTKKIIAFFIWNTHDDVVDDKLRLKTGDENKIQENKKKTKILKFKKKIFSSLIVNR